MAAFTHHLFVCCNQRSPGHRRGCCDPDGSASLRTALKAEIQKRGLKPHVRANSAGCLDQCEHGPTLAIYPQGIFYGNVTPEDVSRIVETTLIQGIVLQDLVINEDCLNNPQCEHLVDNEIRDGLNDETGESA